jgi:hypothetical protein
MTVEAPPQPKHRLWCWASFWYALCGRCSHVMARGSWHDAGTMLLAHLRDKHEGVS